MIPIFTSGAGSLENSADFILMLDDLGSGAVNTTPQKSGGSPTATFSRATTAWTYSSTGTVLSVASGTARSYYTPSGIYGGFLAEAASTNLCQRSEDFSAVWAAVGTPTLSANTTTRGVLNLSTVGDDSASVLEGYTQTITFTADAVKAIAIYVKQGTSTSSVIRLRDTSANADRLLAAITWSGTTPVVTMTAGTNLTGTPQQLASSGVYRLLFATTSVTAANTNSLQLYPATDAALSVANVGTIEWGGVTAEDATFPTTYIQTPGSATVARSADILSYAFASNMTEGTGSCYGEIQPFRAANGGNQFIVRASRSDFNNTIAALNIESGGGFQIATSSGGVFDGAAAGGVASSAAVTKAASSWVTNLLTCVSGGVTGTDTSWTIPSALTIINVGSDQNGTNHLGGTVKNVRIWLTTLTSTQLLYLTS